LENWETGVDNVLAFEVQGLTRQIIYAAVMEAAEEVGVALTAYSFTSKSEQDDQAQVLQAA
jgi:hypothetical protein